MKSSEINIFKTIQSSLTNTHTYTREREMRERETRQAAEDKTVGLQFLLGLVFTGLAEPGKRTGKHNNKKTETTVKNLHRPFLVMWRGT